MERDASDAIRSQCREDFVRRVEVEDLARTVVEGLINGGELLMSNLAEIHALGQVFADQAGGVFIGATLPRAVGIAEEDVELQLRTTYFTEQAVNDIC